MTPDEWSDEPDAEQDDAQHEPHGNSQEVFQSGHDRTVTERLHTFTCKVCARTLTIMQYPAPSRQVCDECKANNAAAKESKAEYMKHYMRAKRAAERAGQPPARRGRPPRQA